MGEVGGERLKIYAGGERGICIVEGGGRGVIGMRVMCFFKVLRVIVRVYWFVWMKMLFVN